MHETGYIKAPFVCSHVCVHQQLFIHTLKVAQLAIAASQNVPQV